MGVLPAVWKPPELPPAIARLRRLSNGQQIPSFPQVS